MSLIQIEQDSLRVIHDAREMIAAIVVGLREEPGDTENHYGQAMHATGFLAALRLYGLISPVVYNRLEAELNQASKGEEDVAQQTYEPQRTERSLHEHDCQC